MPALTIVVANLKGGSTKKTTTAAFVLHALAEAGLPALGVDADGENESLLAWSETGGECPYQLSACRWPTFTASCLALLVTGTTPSSSTPPRP